MNLDPKLIASFENQVKWCALWGSPFTATLLSHALEDLKAGGPVAEVVSAWPGGDPIDGLVALRFAGGLNALVLQGKVPDLAAHYPDQRPKTDGPALWATALSVIEQHTEFLHETLRFPPQTNEVARAGCLLGGFLFAHKRFPLPINLLEIGASGGLNLFWDRFRYELGGTRVWGPEDSPVKLQSAWSGSVPRFSDSVAVASRAGCDLNPVDWQDEEQALRMQSYIWPDMADRVARFKAAAGMAKQYDLRVDKADAADWLAEKLAHRMPGHLTIVYHSIFWTYLPKAVAASLQSTLGAVGSRASEEAPLAWVRMEPDFIGDEPDLIVTLWPSGETQTLARCHVHGAWVKWA